MKSLSEPNQKQKPRTVRTKLPNNICIGCGASYTPYRSAQRYCTIACREDQLNKVDDLDWPDGHDANGYPLFALCNHALYATWVGMLKRCTDPRCPAYKYYGARGVMVCDRWRQSFKAFVQDMRKKPSKQHSLERVANFLGYCPTNCKWALPDEQAQNTRVSPGWVKIASELGLPLDFAGVMPDQRHLFSLSLVPFETPTSPNTSADLASSTAVHSPDADKQKQTS